MDKSASSTFPKGRGAWLSDIVDSGGLERSEFTLNGFSDSGLCQGPSCTPVRECPETSTPYSDVDAVHRLKDMVGHLGAQIGESIVAKLMLAGVVNTNSDSQTASPTLSTQVHNDNDRDLQTFTGDGTDKYSVQDWIDMTETHLRKQATPVCDKANEIMHLLLGKARNVVKIASCSDPKVDVKKRPELIHNVLLHYFGDTPSCLPLSDFYAVLPKRTENPVDYWLRLNKAADLALEGLCRQGRHSENMNEEVAFMFVKHFPDPEFSSVLKLKPIHESTSHDVQLRIDDYKRELRVSGRTYGAAQVKSHLAAISSAQPSAPPSCPAASEDVCTPSPSTSSLQAQHHACHGPCHSVASVQVQGVSQYDKIQSFVPVVAQNLQQSEERLLNRMVDTFQKMMEKMEQCNTSHPNCGGSFQRVPRDRRQREES
ncbi:uncharacterized protein LOC133485100 [Phyllopteryx taeniolatus]|uniref:uncharacterized protein LOC133485100 n=1 Tax=Phyllopteryx taeniolatus TaxID=161469 RepID=UPI002AD36646|nr:uncharacterized protein LOC133485100 [Phyllopteryx taeniolatus]